MGGEPRIRVSALLGWHGQILLSRHEKPGREYWLLPGGGVDAGESLTDALYREMSEELGIDESIAPKHVPRAKHVVHSVFAGDLTGLSLETVRSEDSAVRGHRLFDRE